MRRLALLVEYDGTPYVGSQLQTNGPSVQAELERAIEEMTGRFARVAFAGRTDAGVHASGQVASFDTESTYHCDAYSGGINVRLPETIAVRAVREIEPDFDIRRRAVARRYRYSIVNSATRSPLQRRGAWQVWPELNIAGMQAAAGLLVGEQDFAAFASPEASGASTVRSVAEASVRRNGRQITIEIEANAFLMHQVRRTAAALVDIGAGRLTLDEFARHLHEARPGSYERAAPPYGLCLQCVKYQPSLFRGQHEDF